MPRPNYGAILGCSHDGVAARYVVLLYFELKESIAAFVYNGSRTCRKLNKVGFVCPNYPCTVDTCIGTTVGFFYPRVVDVVAKVVFKVTKYISTRVGGFVRTSVIVAFRYGVAINQWNTVETRGRDNVTIGSAARS